MSDFLVKGTPTIVSRDWVDERLGSGWFHQTIVARHKDWPERLLPNEFYPLGPQVYAWRKVVHELDDYDSVHALVEQAAAATAEQDLRTIYKAFLWATKPTLFLRAVPRIWSMYARFGEIETLENETGTYRAKVSSIPENLLGWSTGSVAGFLRPALLLAGGTQPDSRVTNRRPGDQGGTWSFDYELRYEL